MKITNKHLWKDYKNDKPFKNKHSLTREIN